MEEINVKLVFNNEKNEDGSIKCFCHIDSLAVEHLEVDQKTVEKANMFLMENGAELSTILPATDEQGGLFEEFVNICVEEIKSFRNAIRAMAYQSPLILKEKWVKI